jgi:hypothetical protein
VKTRSSRRLPPISVASSLARNRRKGRGGPDIFSKLVRPLIRPASGPDGNRAGDFYPPPSRKSQRNRIEPGRPTSPGSPLVPAGSSRIRRAGSGRRSRGCGAGRRGRSGSCDPTDRLIGGRRHHHAHGGRETADGRDRENPGR